MIRSKSLPRTCYQRDDVQCVIYCIPLNVRDINHHVRVHEDERACESQVVSSFTSWKSFHYAVTTGPTHTRTQNAGHTRDRKAIITNGWFQPRMLVDHSARPGTRRGCRAVDGRVSACGDSDWL